MPQQVELIKSTCAPACEQGNLVGRAAKNRLVMAVPVQQNLAPSSRPPQTPVHSPQANRPAARSAGASLRVRVVREKFQQFVLEDAGATRLKKDERQSRPRFAASFVQALSPDKPRADPAAQNRKAAARSRCAPQAPPPGIPPRVRTFSGNQRLRMVIVIPRVGPQNHLPRRLAAPRAAQLFWPSALVTLRAPASASSALAPRPQSA